ncbi:MAG: SLBB domain-containing protein [Spirochaetota bacterium]
MNKRLLVISGALFVLPFWLAFSQSMDTTSFTDILTAKSVSGSNQSDVSSNVSVGTAGSSFSDALDSPSNMAQRAMSTESYPVTPGDIYTLTFITASGVQTLSLYVGTDYSIQVGSLGVLDGKNKTFLALSSQIQERVLKAYPLSSPQLYISSVGIFPVKLVGEVARTKEVYVWALTRLSSLLNGNLTTYSSTRDVMVRNERGEERQYDLFKASRYGVLEQDPYVRRGDTIIINRVERQVTISGEVRRPGTYQLVKGENLASLIEQYGMGFTEKADATRVEITRYVDGKDKSGEKIQVNYKDEDIPIQNRDVIVVGSTQDLLPVLFIEGAIQTSKGGEAEGSNRILHQFVKGETLGKAIRSHRNELNQVADLEHAYITRNSSKIPVNLQKFLFEKDFTDDIVLEPNDVLTIPFQQFFVTVSGAVKSPGRYPYIPDRTWRYYVSLAGGIDEERNVGEKIIVTDMSDNPLPKDGIIPPEAKIKVPNNSFLYYFGRYSPIVTTMLSIISTTISILLISGIHF